MRTRTLVFFIASLVFSCTYDPAYDLTCSDDGAIDGDRQCIDGVWVLMDAGTNPDVDQCQPRDDQTICDDETAECGEVTVTECDEVRTVTCGSCEGTDECVDNVCVCVPESDEELCEEAMADCGSLTATDRCGDQRNIDCGACPQGEECGVGGTPNRCACPEADDEALCIDNGAECGELTADDPVCGTTRTVNCGGCQSPDTCGGGGTANECGCSEDAATFCDRLDKNCGLVSAIDICGIQRTDIDCGTCSGAETCGGGGVLNECGCDEATICADVNIQCGMTDVAGTCSNLDTVDCGDCGPDGTCMQNSCDCNDGYSFVDGICTNDDECSLGTDNCDDNATCDDTPGGFTCACNDGYDGNGIDCTPLPPTIAETVGGQGRDPVSTDPISGVEDDLYIAFVSILGTGFQVTSVDGLGLTWTEADTLCNGSDEQRVSIWWARGTPAVGSDSIVADLDGTPTATVVAVHRITNVPSSGSPGMTYFVNSNGPNGACDSSNPETSYSFSYTVVDDNALVLAGTALHKRAHTAGADWTEEIELHESGTANSEAGLAVMWRNITTPGSITVDGTFDGINNWVTGVFEVTGL